MSGSRPRIVLVAPRYPYPPWRGDQVRILHLVKGLSRRCDVTLVSFGDATGVPIEGVRVRSVARSAMRSLSANLATPAPLLPAQVRAFLDVGMRRAVREAIQRVRPHVVHAALARMAPYLPTGRTDVHRHLDVSDSLAANMASRAEAAGPVRGAPFALEARLMRRYERRMALAADSVTVVAEADRLSLGVERASVLPNGVDVDDFDYREPRSSRPVITFFGNLGYFHNAQPAEIVAREVAPAVRAVEPDTVIRLVGTRPSARVRQLASLPGVELRESVPEMAGELHQAAVAMLPMFSGTGMKNKVLEAFSCGLPVVTNSAGIQGIPGAVAGIHYLKAEDPRELADGALRLLGDPEERCRLARAARQLVEERHSWDQQIDRLLAIYGVDCPA